jgi:hypothetical protein
MSDEPQRPTTDDRAAWQAYWQAQGMPWRTEPWRGKRGNGSWLSVWVRGCVGP